MKKTVRQFRDFVERECGKHIERMILFGSSVEGKRTNNSDIDMLVIWKGDRRRGWERLERIAFQLLLETEQYISLKVITPEEFRKMQAIGNPFIKNIQKEGVILI